MTARLVMIMDAFARFVFLRYPVMHGMAWRWVWPRAMRSRSEKLGYSARRVK